MRNIPRMTLKDANMFFQTSPIAIVGVSSTGTRFGASAFRTLLAAGYEVVPINPKIERFEGHYCYQKISQMKQPPGAVVIVTKPENTLPILAECRSLKVKRVWFQPGSESREALAYCAQNGIKAYSGYCVLLFTQVFPHNVHLFFLKLFGKVKS
jgi:predicted CoA-binding protein